MHATIEAGVHVFALGGGGYAVIKRKSNIPLVTVAIGGRGGVHNETAANAGITGLAARASLKGTASRTANQIAQLAEEMGGSVSPSVGSDMLDWEMTVPSRHYDRALELLADVAFNAAFREDAFEIERKLVLADIQQTRDDMYRYPLRLCLQQAFRGHAYGNTLSSIEASLARTTAAEAAAWYARQVRAQPWVFVVGDVDPDAAARAIESALPVTVSGPRATPPDAEWRGHQTQEVETRDKAQTALALGFPGPAGAHRDSYTLQVLANAVGGLGGRFFEELRSKRSLAYTVSLIPVARWLGGAFVAYIGTAPEREAEARSALLEQFRRLQDEPLSQEEVSRAQRYTIGTWQIRSQTNGAQLGDLMHAYLIGEGVAEIVEFEERIRAVTPEAIQAAARSWFDPARMVEGIVRGKGKT
jgi:zinc protease